MYRVLYEYESAYSSRIVKEVLVETRAALEELKERLEDVGYKYIAAECVDKADVFPDLVF